MLFKPRRWTGCALAVGKPSFGGRHGDQRRAQHPLGDQVALLQHADHGVGLLLGGHHADRLMLVRVEPGAGGGVDLEHLVALQRAGQLAQGGVDPLEHLVGGGAGNGGSSVRELQSSPFTLDEYRTSSNGSGGTGGVRIIWTTNQTITRAFPSTNVGQL